MNKVLLFILLTLLVIVIILVVTIGPIFKKYSRIFSLNHYREICVKMSNIKEAAIKAIPTDTDDSPIKRDDPRTLITSAGLAIFYTISKTETTYEHHFSISMPGQDIPHAIGEHFSIYVADLMAWEIHDAVFFFSDTPVFHARLELPSDKQLAWEKTLITLPRVASKDDIRKRNQELRAQVKFHSVSLPEKDNPYLP
jgi:hypothetical protein